MTVDDIATEITSLDAQRNQKLKELFWIEGAMEALSILRDQLAAEAAATPDEAPHVPTV